MLTTQACRKTLKSLSGIETVNPTEDSANNFAGKLLNPYQGLKRVRISIPGKKFSRKTLKSLSGIETWLRQEYAPHLHAGKLLNPYQGLKRKIKATSIIA